MAGAPPEPGTALETCTAEGALAVAATLRQRLGFAPERTRYLTDALGRVRVEAFELHAAEHCNLRCANCCNMSPLVPRRFLEVAEVESICATLAPALHADVVKIMGGEPLLHPELPAILRALRTSGIGDRVRLFTNGLLLKSMPEAFWEALDELTISDYASAPVPRATLELARARSVAHDFVLNVKPVGEFSHVLSPRFQGDAAAVTDTYRRCWLRHRCLVVRHGRFYMCTRAAYADDFLATVEHQPLPEGVVLDRSGDGVPIDAPGLGQRLADYLGRSTPLGACSYCFGGDGAVEPHYQLTRAEVASGRLSRRLGVLP
ncbi:MAG: radical SAM protein [Polyangiaceae bacterium]